MSRLTVSTSLLDMLTTGGNFIPRTRMPVRHIAFVSVLVLLPGLPVFVEAGNGRHLVHRIGPQYSDGAFKLRSIVRNRPDDPRQAEREGFSLGFFGSVIMVPEWPGVVVRQRSNRKCRLR